MRAKWKDTVFSVFGLLVIVILSINCNIADFWNGANGTINPITLAVTAVYICYCSAFALFAHKKISLIAMVVWAAMTLVFAMYIVLRTAFVPPKVPGPVFTVPGLILFLSPFQGMTAILSNNRLVIYSIISMICVLWIAVSVFRLGRCCKRRK